MLLYLAIFATVSLLALSGVLMNKPRAVTVVEGLAIAVLFWTLSFSRWENGTDWEPYSYVYSSMALHGTIRDAFSGFMAMEPGYLMTNLALAWANSYHLFLCVIGLVVIGLKTIRIIDLSVCVTYSFLIYLASLLGDIFFVRQSIAISICFFSLKYLLDRKPWRFVFCVLLAATFHVSAIIFLIALLAGKETPRSPLRDALVLASCGLLSIFFLNRLVELSANIFLPFQYVANRLAYITNNQSVSELSSASRNVLRMMEKIAVYFFFLWRYQYIEDKYRRTYLVLLNLYFVSTLMTCCLSIGAVQVLRFAFYFSTSEILLFPLAIISFRGLNRQLCAVAVACYSLLRFLLLLQPYYDLYIPYKFFELKI